MLAVRHISEPCWFMPSPFTSSNLLPSGSRPLYRLALPLSSKLTTPKCPHPLLDGLKVVELKALTPVPLLLSLIYGTFFYI